VVEGLLHLPNGEVLRAFFALAPTLVVGAAGLNSPEGHYYAPELLLDAAGVHTKLAKPAFVDAFLGGAGEH
jgi:hypothetical protein